MSFSPGDYSEWVPLAEGGEAEVFRARQASLDRQVAIKRLKLSSIGRDEEVNRFEREAKLFASLSHPALVQIYDYGRDPKFYYQVMEYIPGADLGRLAGTTGNTGLPESAKVAMARQMAEVVDFIHQKGVLHRDLKPENFMVDAAGRIKLLDLGMARGAMGSQLGHTDAKGGLIKGTLAYLPPEILRGQGPWQKGSEYYCLALVLFELFGDLRLQQGRTAEELLALIQGGIPVSTFPTVPPAISELLSPYLDPDPAGRPSGLEFLVKGLRRMQTDTSALGGGRSALEAAVVREQRAWLWSLATAMEEDGRTEEAFARLKELLNIDPGDLLAQAKLQDLGMRLNDAVPEKPVSLGRRRANTWVVASAVPVITLLAGLMGAWIFYIQRAPEAEEMGLGLMEKELSILSKENEERYAQASPASTLLGESKPSIRPYGVLVINGLPKGYQVLVNRIHYPSDGEIHLPANRHLLEIQDDRRRPVLRDSITVGGGEPTVFEFARKAAPPLFQRAGEP